MPKFNWRSLDDTYYDQIEQAEMTGMAWECLRRNASFERDCRTIPSSSPITSAEFRERWGLVFRRRPRTIFFRTDNLLGSRDRADDCTGPPRGARRRTAFTRQSRSQQPERESISTRSGWLARRAIPAWRGASYLVQGSAYPRRCLHSRIAARPRLRIQGRCRFALVARSQWPASGCTSARHFSSSPAANCACLACRGCMERRRYLLGDR